MFGLPIKLSEMAEAAPQKAPAPGEHNDLVLARLIGLSPQELDAMKSQGTI
jgi:CoA:oxalate CoA-transferase